MSEFEKVKESATIKLSLWVERRRTQDAGNLIDMITEFGLEQRAEEAEWWVEDLALGGNDLEGDTKHLRGRAADLRRQAKDRK